MVAERNPSSRSLDYGVGALVVLVVSVGFAAIVYSANVGLVFNLLNLPAWIFGPFGVYTIIYSFAARKDTIYYLVWGTVMFAVAFVSAFYGIIEPLIVFGVLLVVIAIIGLIAYMRSKK